MRLIFHSLPLFIALMMASCSFSPKQPECAFADGSNQPAPAWVCSKDTNEHSLSIIIYADKSATGLNFMKQMAESSAHFELAKKLKLKVSRMLEAYAGNVGFSDHQSLNKILAHTLSLINSNTLKQSRTIHQQITPTSGIVIMVYISESDLQKVIKKTLQQSITNHPRLWQKLMGHQSQVELINAIVRS